LKRNINISNTSFSCHSGWRIVGLCLFLSFGLSSEAQDIHYTQFTLQPLQQSPTSAGDFDGDYRFATLYRNQWATVSVPYNTFGFAFDMKAFESKKFTSFLGVGGNAFYDQAGDGKLQSIYVQIPVSYNVFIPIGKRNTMKIGAGLYAGFLNKSLNTSRLQFDNQYSGDVYDPNIPNAENFGNLSFIKPDIGMGYQVAFNVNQKASFGLAFGVHHLNKIQESFIDDGVHITLQKRYSIPVFMQFELNKKWDLRFDYIFQEQGKFYAHNFGAITSYYLKKDGPAKTAIEFGSYYRYKDALSAIVRYRKNNFLAGLSYDVNLSPLNAATNTYGGVEIGLVYLIKKLQEPEIKNKRKCFVF
jgi:type IX secretion system PorP/SprF family membrane protein